MDIIKEDQEQKDEEEEDDDDYRQGSAVGEKAKSGVKSLVKGETTFQKKQAQGAREIKDAPSGSQKKNRAKAQLDPISALQHSKVYVGGKRLDPIQLTGAKDRQAKDSQPATIERSKEGFICSHTSIIMELFSTNGPENTTQISAVFWVTACITICLISQKHGMKWAQKKC